MRIEVHEELVVFDFSSETPTVSVVAKEKGNDTLVHSVKDFLGGRDFDWYLVD
jgi:hypothetical protein